MNRKTQRNTLFPIDVETTPAMAEALIRAVGPTAVRPGDNLRISVLDRNTVGPEPTSKRHVAPVPKMRQFLDLAVKSYGSPVMFFNFEDVVITKAARRDR